MVTASTIAWARRLALTLLCTVPCLLGSPTAGTASAGKTEIRVALPVPRTRSLVIAQKQYNERLAELSDGKLQFRVYWGGAAGDDHTVLRKLKTGQIDVSVFTSEVMGRFVPSATVLTSPALYFNYAQIDAVRKELSPALNAECYGNGFQALAWGDVGRIRVFSNERIGPPSDFKRLRPWLYPDSEVLKSFYRIIGASGVPLGLHEVYGAMQTGMIDTYWATASLASTLQWHRTASFVSERSVGFLTGGVVMRRQTWDGLDQDIQEGIAAMVRERTQTAQHDVRVADDRIYKKLLKRGYSLDQISARDWDAWWKVGHELRRRLVGRLYSRELVAKAEAIALQYADSEQKRRYQAR